MITVSNQSWHARIYLAWFQKKYGYRESNVLTNLCPYMRAILVWAPLRFLFGNWFTVPATITIKGETTRLTIPHGIITAPIAWIAGIKLIGYVSYNAKIVFFVLTMGCTLLGIAIILISTAAILLDDTETVNRATSFIALTGKWIKSKHSKLCPSIDIK